VSGRPATDGEAMRQLDHTMAAAVGASRVFVLAQSVAIIWTLRRRVRHPALLLAGATSVAGQTTWAVRRARRGHSIRDPGIALSDGLVQCLALVTEAASWGSRVLPDDPRWSETFGAVLTSWVAFEEPSRSVNAGSLLSWIATYLATTSSRSAAGAVVARGKRINEIAGHVALTGVGRLLGRQLLGQAAELDAARAEAVTQAERLATELERRRQHRIIHDSALQVLEAVAGGWDLDDELLRSRIDYETARLRRLLDQSMSGSRPLVDQLDSLVAVFAELGLRVELDATELRPPRSQTTADALADATHEALMNVHKHAGVASASVRAKTAAAGTEVLVVDAGRGFDLTKPRRGFGVSESIEGRLRDIGGRATVASAPGRGTTVCLRVPS
jgi:signal transduction histidine kinase